VGAAVDFTACFDAMPEDATLTVFTPRRELVNRALEAVECVLFTSHRHSEGFVVIVAAGFTFH
jgi:hypothetical protein